MNIPIYAGNSTTSEGTQFPDSSPESPLPPPKPRGKSELKNPMLLKGPTTPLENPWISGGDTGVGLEEEEEEEDEEEIFDDTVIIRQPQDPGGPRVITVNCPDKTGLGCDLCRVLLCFGVSVVRGDMSTDGRWCYVVLWVVGRRETKWGLLRKRLVEVRPSVNSGEFHGYHFGGEAAAEPEQPQVFLLKSWCSHRLGLLRDVTGVLRDLELTIRKVKVSTTPEGRVVGLFFVTDSRGLLHTKRRKADVSCKLYEILGEAITRLEIEPASAEIAAHIEASAFLPPDLARKVFGPNPSQGSLPSPNNIVHITMDNSLSPSHTLIQISCHESKGLLYDILRTAKEFNIQLSYGRLFANPQGKCEIDLFVMQLDGKKIIEPCKQEALSSRLRSDLLRPLLVNLVDRGPDSELLVANPVEVSGRGRPLVFHDVTLALKLLRTHIFAAEMGRHMVGDREWEVYRILLSDGYESSVNRDVLEGCVMRKLMGWPTMKLMDVK